MATTSRAKVARFVSCFIHEGEIKELSPITQGHINETWLSTVDVQGRLVQFVHQRINPAVFPDGLLVLENIERITHHLRNSGSYHYDVLELLEVKQQKDSEGSNFQTSSFGRYWKRDEEGAIWRTYRFIEGAVAHNVCPTPECAFEGGRAFGSFLRGLTNLSATSLHLSLPGFQNIAGRLSALGVAEKDAPKDRMKDAAEELSYAHQSSERASSLSFLLTNPARLRITHGDTKLNNVLFDRESGVARCVIDLDTVMPGSPLYDYGDFARQIGVRCSEDEILEEVPQIQWDFLRAGTQGFLAGVGTQYFSEDEFKALGKMPWLISFTLGVRFLTDYLSGDRYFRISYEGHNLVRARCQFAIASAYLEGQEELSDLIEGVVPIP